MQQKPNIKLQNLLKTKKANTQELDELSKIEQNRLVTLKTLLDELRRGEDVQNRRLTIWLADADYGDSCVTGKVICKSKKI